MSQQTFFVPVSFTHLPQEPQAGSDTPTSGTRTGSDTATAGTTDPSAGGAQGGQPADPPACGGDGMLWMMPMFLVLMYFMMIRPEQKRRKEQQTLLASIKVDDRVVMLSGMHGVVTSLDADTVNLRVDAIQMTFDRSAVARIVREEASS